MESGCWNYCSLFFSWSLFNNKRSSLFDTRHSLIQITIPWPLIRLLNLWYQLRDSTNYIFLSFFNHTLKMLILFMLRLFLILIYNIFFPRLFYFLSYSSFRESFILRMLSVFNVIQIYFSFILLSGKICHLSLSFFVNSQLRIWCYILYIYIYIHTYIYYLYISIIYVYI